MGYEAVSQLGQQSLLAFVADVRAAEKLKEQIRVMQQQLGETLEKMKLGCNVLMADLELTGITQTRLFQTSEDPQIKMVLVVAHAESEPRFVFFDAAGNSVYDT